MRKIWRYALGSAFLGVCALAVSAAGYLYWSSRQPVLSGAESFLITSGSGVRQVAGKLVNENILPEPYTFLAWSYVKGDTTRIHAGEYAIPGDIVVAELLALFVSGKVIQRSVTFIEGWTFEECRQALYNADRLKIETRGWDGGQIMKRLDDDEQRPEGRFFPDTYHYTADMSDLDLLRQARDAMRRILDEEWENRDPSTTLKNRHQALVLASIIEKETGRSGERDVIAGVFHNRLKKGMRLQTDPTVIYGLGDEFDGNLTRAHLAADTPYNTYTRAGLPPTPIAMPGRASIRAALHPAETPALYFVSRGDGSHVFSETLEEHNRNVLKYQIRRKRQPDPGAGTGDEAESDDTGD